MWTYRKFTMLLWAVLLLAIQCTSHKDNTTIRPCDCTNSSSLGIADNVEAEVIQTPIIVDGQPVFALNIKQSDFGTGGSYSAGDNILLPCDSLENEYKQRGLPVKIAYTQKDCSAGLTSPNFRVVFGRIISLESIRKAN